jgi:hypothetical protein
VSAARKARSGPKPQPKPPVERRARPWAAPALLVLLVLVFYWVPLTSSSASIQWDAADMHYPLQRYFSDHVRSASLPFWTPYVFSGYPFLANTEVAAWYPPHWPFFLAGITPRAIQMEIAASALIALLGAFLFFGAIVRNRAAALVGAIAYAFSGFFAGHASHIGICAAAAWLPWLFFAYRTALDRAPERFAALGAAVGGCMILAGYFQTALYSFLALGLYGAADFFVERRPLRRAAGVLAGIALGAVALSAIATVPGLEATAESVRAHANFSGSTEGVLHAAPLVTLVAPDHLGALSGSYRGPADVTQYYFYSGLLLLPLAIVGALRSRLRIPALAVLVPAIWYMFGPAAGFYRLGAVVPGLHMVRAPVQGWFVAGFALATLAAAGAAWIFDRWPHRAIPIALAAVFFLDVFYWNSLHNPLAYARAGFDELYGAGEAAAARIAGVQPPLTRLYEPHNALALGPLDHALDVRLETTSGYFALEPKRAVDYGAVATRNPKLLDSANAARYVNVQSGSLLNNPGVLPRAYFPPYVRDVASDPESVAALETLDPHVGSTVAGPHAPVRQDASATAEIVSRTEQSYDVRYRAASPSLLKLTDSWFPGWHATLGGAELPLVRVDHAFMGVVLPAGSGVVRFAYRPRFFWYGAALSLVAAAVLALVAWRVFPIRRRAPIH